jgi:hypothetical protein
MCLSQGISRKGRKKALLIAVRYVRGIEIPLPRTHYDVQEFKELLMSSFFSSCVEPYILTLLQTSMTTPKMKL